MRGIFGRQKTKEKSENRDVFIPIHLREEEVLCRKKNQLIEVPAFAG
jgi:hypothetical protein